MLLPVFLDLVGPNRLFLDVAQAANKDLVRLEVTHPDHGLREVVLGFHGSGVDMQRESGETS